MATTGTNYTAKWELVDGVLTISPVSGNSGEMRGPWHILTPEAYITKVIDMTDEEWNSVTSIVFVGDITIKAQNVYGNYYCYVANLFTQMGAGTLDVASIPNVTSIDVRGLNTTNCESFSNMFYRLTSLTEIIGIDTLNMSAVTDYSGMFEYTKLSELDLSSFSNMNTAKISSMIMAMNYLSTLTLPSNFSRTSPLLNNEDATYQGFGIANSQIYATNSQTQVTISSDNDFFALETGQGGTWIRDISGSATLSFKINLVQRDGNNVIVSYSYATSTATAYVYLKESSASSFPQNPTTSIPLSGTGNDSFTLTLSTDGSYEMQIIVTDGNTNLYVFASIDSNVLLIELDTTGNTKQSGRATTKDMTTQEVDDFVDGLNVSGGSAILDMFYPVGSYYETSDASFNPNVKWGGEWIPEVEGQVHVSAGTNYLVSGALTNTNDDGSPHAVIVKHNHLQSPHNHTQNSHHHIAFKYKTAQIPTGTSGAIRVWDYAHSGDSTANTNGVTATNIQQTAVNIETGVDGTNKNMMPYIVVYRWHRIA